MIKKISGLGINVDINHFDEKSISQISIHLKNLQVQWIRIEIDYFKYKNAENRILLLHFLKQCNRKNILIVGLFSQFVAGNVMSVFFSNRFNKPVNHYLTDYLEFVEQVVKECKKYISHWEIWNEPNSKRFWINNPNAEEYVMFLQLMSSLIQRIQPNAQIIFGGIVGNDVTPIISVPKRITQYVDFIKESISHGADKYVHHYGFHPYILDCYISFKNKEQLVEVIKKRIYEAKEKYKDQSLIITEFGISSTLQFRITEEDISSIYRSLATFLEELQIPLCIYTLIDLDSKHFFKFNPERGFGLLAQTLEKKNIFTHLLNSSKSLRDR